MCWDGYRSVPNLGKICPILSEDWSKGIDTSIWTQEVRTDGYGHGSFAWTTSSSNNSFVKDGTMYIVPTLSSDQFGAAAISNGYTLNLTADGTCTSTNVSDCVAVSNSSRLTVINPVQSARLTTRQSLNIKYGKVEVVAKFPTGDWLWPSITMLPVNETYGAWPRSGQIDILTGRGNNASYVNRGVDYAQSDLHWGPTEDLDRLYMTWGYREQRRTYYNQKYHTFGLEWNDKYMWTYIDSKVSQVISLRFNKDSFWERGKFPGTVTNTTTGDVVKLTDPWIASEENVAPFDQRKFPPPVRARALTVHSILPRARFAGWRDRRLVPRRRWRQAMARRQRDRHVRLLERQGKVVEQLAKGRDRAWLRDQERQDLEDLLALVLGHIGHCRDFQHHRASYSTFRTFTGQGLYAFDSFNRYAMLCNDVR